MEKDITSKIMEHKLIQNSAKIYEKHKHFTPLISFTAGFLLDVFTLGRIDTLRDNLIIAFYIAAMGLFIILINLVKEDKIEKQFLLKYAEWYPIIVQFLSGGVFSKYVVFYFQSASMGKHWLFILLLVVVLVGNEFIHDKYSNIKFQFVLYFLACFSFFIFSIPVLIGTMGTGIFILSGLLSLIYTLVILYFMFIKIATLDFSRFRTIAALLSAVYLLLTLFYFLNWIPPVPLSQKRAEFIIILKSWTRAMS